MWHKILAGLTLVISVFAMNNARADLGCSSDVVLNGGVIEVSATGGDDTENIQCALQAGADNGFREVVLLDPEYSTGYVSVTNFIGDFRGKSSDATTVNVQDGSLSCSASAAGAAFEFLQGTPTLRRMTINASEPCGNQLSASIVAFYTNANDCSKRVVYGFMDRVVLGGAGVNGNDVVTGVTMDAAPGCDASVLGSLKINRVVFNSLDVGVISSLGGGGQLDINYNEFNGNGLPIAILDASQSATILANKISYNDVAGYSAGSGLGTTGIFIGSTIDSPSSNGTVIRSNTFTDGGVSTQGFAIISGQADKAIVHGLNILQNTFNGNSGDTSGAGIAVFDTNDGAVAGNVFKNYSSAWIYLDSDALPGTVSGWSITANSFSGSTGADDIYLGAGTTGNVVGRNQDNPAVTDAGSGNDILEGVVSASTFGAGGSSVSSLVYVDLAKQLQGTASKKRALAK